MRIVPELVLCRPAGLGLEYEWIYAAWVETDRVERLVGKLETDLGVEMLSISWV